MRSFSSILRTQVFSTNANQCFIQDCTFHGITMMHLGAAPINIHRINDENSLLSIKNTVISQCSSISTPTDSTVGALYTTINNVTIDKCLILGCVGYYSTFLFTEEGGKFSFNLNNTIMMKCEGTEIMSVGPALSSMNLNNITEMSLKLFNFVRLEHHEGIYINMSYASISNIQCLESFKFPRQFFWLNSNFNVINSNFIMCEFHDIFGTQGEDKGMLIFYSCYFVNCTGNNINGHFNNCFFNDTSFTGISDETLNYSSMMSLPIIKFDEFNIRQEQTTWQDLEQHDIINISFSYNEISIKRSVFSDIMIVYSTETVISIYNSLFRSILIENSYFKNISTNTGAGVIMLFKGTSDLQVNITKNLVHNCFNIENSFMIMAPETNRPLFLNSSVISFDQTYEYLMRFVISVYNDAATVNYLNLTTDKNKIVTPIGTDGFRDINIFISDNVQYCNFYNSTRLNNFWYCVGIFISSCNIIDVHCNDDFFVNFDPFVSEKWKNYHIISCAFIDCNFSGGSKLPHYGDLKNCSTDIADLKTFDNVDFKWATPKPIPLPKKNILQLALILTAVCSVIIILSIVSIYFVTKKRLDTLKRQKQLERKIIEDFG